MDVGLLVPQGWKHEYDGWDAAQAWSNSIAYARRAEALGFGSLWVFDHFHTVPEPTDEITFESFTMLAALAASTTSARLGHMVICTGFRNPALTAKMAATIDVISGGRFELGIGAGWKQDEWLAYGYGFPPTPERLGALGDHLEIITRMLAPGHATYDGQFASVRDAYNVPKGIAAHIPIIVGGNGPHVTQGLAVRYADELNLVMLPPDEVSRRIEATRSRCVTEGRDPDTLRFSLYCSDPEMKPGPGRVEALRSYGEIGLDRLVCFPARWDPTPDGAAAFAQDAQAAGLLEG